jgi:lysophospholipase L1-like esterase
MLKKAFILLLSIGWFLFLILAWFSRDRIMDKLGVERGASDNRMLVRARKEWFANDLALNPWLGDRPPVLFLGDSHLELGKWYPLFRGRFPVRNMGISMSRIADLREIADRVDPEKASALVILSGSNDLTGGDSVDDCLASFRDLFEIIKNRFPGRPVIVLSLPPAGRDLGGQSLSNINAKIGGLNKGLAKEAPLHGFTFLDVAPLLVKDNALNPAFTFDGQHLNDAGYAAIANPLFQTLSKVCPQTP